jgi:hypothetical protein
MNNLSGVDPRENKMESVENGDKKVHFRFDLFGILNLMFVVFICGIEAQK